MSNFHKKTKHPTTGKWELAVWLDNFFGGHRYGVIFSDKRAYNPEKIKLETK